MESPRWLRLMSVGIILAVLAGGYFLLSGRLSSLVSKPQPSPSPSILGENQQSPSPFPTQTPASAYTTITNRAQGGAQVLPSTGFPVGLAVVFSISAIISGWGLRKYPK